MLDVRLRHCRQQGDSTIKTKLLLSLVFFSAIALGTLEQNYGLGGFSSGRAASVTAEIENPYASLYNPALLSAQSNPLLSFSTLVTATSFGAIRGVIIDSPEYRTTDGVARIGDFQLPATHSVLWSFGMTYPFQLPKSLNRRAGIGVVLSGPFDKLRSFQASTPYDFFALRYGTSDNQFKGVMAGSVELWPDHLYLGAGVSVFISTAGSADAMINSSNPTGRLLVDVGLNTAVVSGLLGRIGDSTASLVYRQAINPSFEQKMSGQAEAFRQPTVTVPFIARSSFYYEPHTFDLEVQHDFQWLKASLGFSYQLWSQYQPSFLVLETKTADGQAQSTRLPAVSMRNTVNPRASVVVPIFADRLSAAGGYQYRFSPVEDLSGPANILDCDTHILGAVIEHRLFEESTFSLSWALYGQYHLFVERKVAKANPQYIGAPGFQLGGSAFTYGLTVMAEL
ncbi:MAG: hypothetical protein HY537_02060 [Deltaproteobacteria bacterium]|nr:hypothetical protein [Deltaproteobacteria bacterium]